MQQDTLARIAHTQSNVNMTEPDGAICQIQNQNSLKSTASKYGSRCSQTQAKNSETIAVQEEEKEPIVSQQKSKFYNDDFSSDSDWQSEKKADPLRIYVPQNMTQATKSFNGNKAQNAYAVSSSSERSSSESSVSQFSQTLPALSQNNMLPSKQIKLGLFQAQTNGGSPEFIQRISEECPVAPPSSGRVIRFAHRLQANPLGVYVIGSQNSNYQDTSNQSGYFRQLVDDTLAGSDQGCNSPAVITNKDSPGPFVSAGSYEQFVHVMHLEKDQNISKVWEESKDKFQLKMKKIEPKTDGLSPHVFSDGEKKFAQLRDAYNQNKKGSNTHQAKHIVSLDLFPKFK